MEFLKNLKPVHQTMLLITLIVCLSAVLIVGEYIDNKQIQNNNVHQEQMYKLNHKEK